jgi:phosphoglycerol transferase MdoB-like AlkP superfamily enzyme
VTLLLVLLSGVLYPVVAFYVAEKLIYEGLHRADTNGADVPAIVALFVLPTICSVATAAVFRRRWQTCVAFGFLSVLGVVAVVVAVLAALAHSGALE